ncbi:hypothetical protein BDP27DRAFT_1378691 [Rhodocollybia butyracea]|uniref:Uncharacterized protein n=1 Tax=Rhodocollybia butyracea TaxID=206335 RepID=A0A9P5P540_9AGAR|nr:hypothetical protein BDP27DRAFT_1378691 [Rhodocollybia butyracea]
MFTGVLKDFAHRTTLGFYLDPWWGIPGTQLGSCCFVLYLWPLRIIPGFYLDAWRSMPDHTCVVPGCLVGHPWYTTGVLLLHTCSIPVVSVHQNGVLSGYMVEHSWYISGILLFHTWSIPVLTPVCKSHLGSTWMAGEAYLVHNWGLAASYLFCTHDLCVSNLGSIWMHEGAYLVHNWELAAPLRP